MFTRCQQHDAHYFVGGLSDLLAVAHLLFIVSLMSASHKISSPSGFLKLFKTYWTIAWITNVLSAAVFILLLWALLLPLALDCARVSLEKNVSKKFAINFLGLPLALCKHVESCDGVCQTSNSGMSFIFFNPELCK